MKNLKTKLEKIFNIQFEIDYCGMSGTSSLIAYLPNDLMFVVQSETEENDAPSLSNYVISTISTIKYTQISYTINPY